MKKFLDYWIMYLYHFAKFINPRDDTWWFTAILYLSLFIFSFFINIFTGFLLLLIYKQVDYEFIETTRSFMKIIWGGIDLLCMFIVFIFFRKDRHQCIEESYKNLTNKKRNLIKISIYLLEISLPVLTFILTRLFLDGDVF